MKAILKRGPGVLRFNLSAWLLLVSLLASVPMLCFSAITFQRQVAERQAQGQEALGRRAAASAIAVHQELKSVVLELRTLSQADIVRNGDLSTLYELARRVVVTDPRIAAFLLTDPQGRQLLRTDEPFGKELPSLSLGQGTPQVFERGETALSTVFMDERSREGRIALTVPMQVEDGHTYAITALVKSSAILERLNDAAWPSGWVAVVLDQRHQIVSRSQDTQRFIGQLSSPSLIRAVDQGQSSFRSLTRDGVDVITSVSDIPPFGWKVAVGRSSTAIDREVRLALGNVLLGGVICAVLGIAFALFVAHVLKQRINTVIDAVREGGDMVHASSAVKEIDQLAIALTSARKSVGRTIAALDAARRDAVTGLRGRALFMQDAAAVIEAARTSGDDHRVALLYIDLDGFKQVNDRLGHEAGDRVLKGVAEGLLKSVRSSDVVGRIGGDEFAACLDAPADKIAGVSEQAVARIVAAVEALGDGVGCSIGVAIGGDSELEVLLDRADKRMLAAKKLGKNRVV
jgi:diguanylate cyclase (GGDEF)-like protein